MSKVTVELQAPDLEPYRASNTGTPFVHRLDSGKPGPKVLVVALTPRQRNLRRDRARSLPENGRASHARNLTLAFANVAAFGASIRRIPSPRASSTRTSTASGRARRSRARATASELRRARELLPFVEEAEFLLDIHSMLESSPPVMICGPLEKGIRFAFDVGIPEHVVSDTGHSNGTRMRDFGGFGDPASPATRFSSSAAALGAQCRARRVAMPVAFPQGRRRDRPAARRPRDRGGGLLRRSSSA
jgi:hypothetical protein